MITYQLRGKKSTRLLERKLWEKCGSVEVWYYGSEVMHRSIPAVQRPPATAGHLQILRCPGPSICQPQGQPRPFDTHAVSY